MARTFLNTCHSYTQQQDHNHSDQESHETNLQYSDSSLSNSSFTSQPSDLHSIPSLTLDHPSTTVHHHCAATLKGHSSYVFSLTLAGDHLYSGSSNGEILIWDHHTEYETNLYSTVVAEGYSAVKSILPLRDKLITAHQDHKIRVWKIDNSELHHHHHKYKLIATIPTINDRCMTLFSGKNLVKVHRHKKSTWVHHVDTVSALAVTNLTESSSLLYSVSWDRTIKIWRTSDFKCLESIQNAHDDAINAVVLSNDGFVYTGSADKTIKIWKKLNGDKKHSLVSVLEKHKSAVNALALSFDGSILYSGACDRSIIVWAAAASGGGGGWAVAGKLRGHTKAILCLCVVGDLLCSGSADKTVRVWRRGSGGSYFCLAVLEGHNGPVKCLTAGLDGRGSGGSCSGKCYLVYSGSLDFDIKVWQIWVPF